MILAQQLNINRFDPDYYPLQLGNHVLGGGFYATRLYHDLRQVAGYVYNVDVSMQASKTRGSYAVTYGCDPENVSKARAMIQRDLEQMRTQDVSPMSCTWPKLCFCANSVERSQARKRWPRGCCAGR